MRLACLLGTAGATPSLAVLPSDSGGYAGALATDLQTAAPPASLVVAQLNGEPRADLLAAIARGGGNSEVSRLMGSSDCGFGISETLSMLEGDARDLAVLRFDGSDALDDFVVSVGKTNDDELMVRDSTTTATLLTPLAGAVAEPRGMASGLLDPDGDPDVVYADESGGQVVVRLGVGAVPPYFGTGSTYSVGGTDRAPFDVATADMDGDGLIDVLTANRTANTVSVLINGGGASFPSVEEYPTTSAGGIGGRTPIRLLAIDLDADGDVDVVTINVDAPGNEPSMSILINDGSGGLEMLSGYPKKLAGVPSAVASDDFNDDGVNDVAVVRAKGSASAVDLLLSRP